MGALILMGLFVLMVWVLAMLRRSNGGSSYTSGAGLTDNTYCQQSSNIGLPSDWMTDPAYWWMVGNIYYNQHHGQSDESNSDDWRTDPARSYQSGNIYHQDETITASCSITDSNWMTDPTCSYMPGNIYHQDDTWSSSGSPGFDTDWNSGSSSSSDNDWNTGSSSFDNDWSSTSSSSFSDDSWSGGSGFGNSTDE